jgi:hypothetical protein
MRDGRWTTALREHWWTLALLGGLTLIALDAARGWWRVVVVAGATATAWSVVAALTLAWGDGWWRGNVDAIDAARRERRPRTPDRERMRWN